MTTCIAIASHSHGASANAIHAAATNDADDGEHAQTEPGVAQHRAVTRAGCRAAMPTICAGLGERGDEPALEVVEMEHLLVVERRERDEADERGREERQRVPDAAQRADLPEDADRLRERRRDLVGADDVGARARRGALPVAAARFLEAQAEDHEHERRRRRTRRTAAASRRPGRAGRRAAAPTIAPTASPIWWKPNTSARTSGG